MPPSSGAAPLSSVETPEVLYLTQRPVIEAVIAFVCRRRGLRGEHAEEFAADVRLRLVQDDYSILRKFQGRSSLQTYLNVVIERLALDYQAAHWGRWRPSVVARAAGAAGIRLEQLVVRDGRRLEDALATIDRELGPVDRLALEALAARFPLRTRRHYVGEEVLERVATDAPDAERLLVRSDEEERFERVKARLAEMMSTLTPSERLLLQLRFEQGMKVADIARARGLDQKRLYRDIEGALGRLRKILESEGLDATSVRAMLASLDPAPGRPETGGAVRLYERNTP